MKKSLLLGSALLISIGAFAQANRTVKPQLAKGAKPALVDHENMVSAGVLKPTTHNSVNVMSNTFTSSRNGFGMLVEETVPLSYNADLNMVAFTHRLPPATGPYAWPTTGLPATGTSGFMVTKYSTDNGATWAGVCYMNNGTAWSRYPSGVIANAPGNTDPAQARFVGTGPCTSSPGGWPFNWFASVPANSTGNITTNDQQADSTSTTANSLSAGTYFSSYYTTTNGTTVWTSARIIDAADNFMGTTIFKGVPNGSGYTWSRPLDGQINNWVVGPTTGNYAASAAKIAFGPDGLTGYIVINGVESDETGDGAKAYSPNVWKTIDGGNTWNKVNDNYAWKANHPYLTSNLILTAYDSGWDGSLFGNSNYPSFQDYFGGEITVDANGVLHYVTAVTPAYSSHPDSLVYGYSGGGFSNVQYDNVDKPYVYDFTTDGNGTWNSKFITFLYTRNIGTSEVIGTDAFWTTDGTASLDYSNRIKVSRSTDGTKIFMTWTDSDTTQTDAGPPVTYIPNKLPSIFYKGLDVATGLYSPTQEAVYFDAVENAFYLYTTSEFVMPSACGYTIPTVYISSSDGSQNATNAIDYNYISDMEVCNTAYTDALTIINDSPISQPYWIVGAKEAKGTVISGVSQNYPNPFSGSTTITVNLNKSDVISLEVTNSLGQVVATKVVKGTAGSNEITIDATNLESGIYFYSVVAGNSKVTRKMSVVK